MSFYSQEGAAHYIEGGGGNYETYHQVHSL